jgi:hypothetical protein
MITGFPAGVMETVVIRFACSWVVNYDATNAEAH